jgi:hypothetical protein
MRFMVILQHPVGAAGRSRKLGTSRYLRPSSPPEVTVLSARCHSSVTTVRTGNGHPAPRGEARDGARGVALGGGLGHGRVWSLPGPWTLAVLGRGSGPWGRGSLRDARLAVSWRRERQALLTARCGGPRAAHPSLAPAMGCHGRRGGSPHARRPPRRASPAVRYPGEARIDVSGGRGLASAHGTDTSRRHDPQRSPRSGMERRRPARAR